MQKSSSKGKHTPDEALFPSNTSNSFVVRADVTLIPTPDWLTCLTLPQDITT